MCQSVIISVSININHFTPNFLYFEGTKMPSQRTPPRDHTTNWSIISSKMKTQTSINNFVWRLFLIQVSFMKFILTSLFLYKFCLHRCVMRFYLLSFIVRFALSMLRYFYLSTHWVTKYDGFGQASKIGSMYPYGAHPNMAKLCVTFAQIANLKHRENSANICTLQSSLSQLYTQTCNCHMHVAMLTISFPFRSRSLTASLLQHSSAVTCVMHSATTLSRLSQLKP